MSDQQLFEGGAPPTAPTGDGESLTSPGTAAADEPRPVAVNGDAIFRKGEARGRAKLLKDLGFADQVEIAEWVRARREAEVEPEPGAEVQPTQPPQDAAAIRKARLELRARETELRQMSERLTRYEAQSSTALRAELRGQLIAAGAHSEAVGDLVALIAPQVRWAEDGEGLEVLDGDEPSLRTLEDLITEQRQARRWFFSPPPQSGSGTQIRTSASPQSSAPQRRETWVDRIARARSL